MIQNLVRSLVIEKESLVILIIIVDLLVISIDISFELSLKEENKIKLCLNYWILFSLN